MKRSSNPVDAYAQAVVDGVIPGGKYHRLSCSRHLADRDREGTPEFPYVFRWESALRFLNFARKMKHYKGRQFAGQSFDPTPCQVFRLGSIFGWRHHDTGLRRFTTAYNELPRKTGKSFEAAAVGVYVTFFEGEPGAEGYCIATKEKQAKIVFGDMKKLVKSSGLSKHIKLSANNLHNAATESKLEPLGSDSDTTDGLNPHLIITDEFHAMKTRDLIDVMESATGARLNPLHFQITTAGDDPVSPCGDQHDYVCKILDGVLVDDASTVSFFGFIAHADDGDDPWDEATWRKANPHWGISVNPEDMRKLAAKAKQMPSAAAEFQQKRLNIWVNTTAPCLSIDGWRRGQTRTANAYELWRSEMRMEKCYIGVDLAKKIDLCAMTLAFPPAPGRPQWRWLQHVWTPKGTLADRAHRDRAPYTVWADQGWLTAVDGVSVPASVVLDAILAARDLFDIQKIGFDPWHASELKDDLVKVHGFAEEDVLDVPQTFAGMGEACNAVQAEILAAGIDAGGCPVTSWSIANVVGQVDGKENLMFAKGKSRGRIDPVISGTIATALKLRQPRDEENIYNTRGVVTLGA